jgi:pentatricopeptide repeat protein
VPSGAADPAADPFAQWLSRRAREMHYTDSQADTADESDHTQEVQFRAPEAPSAPRQTIRPEPVKDHQHALIERFMKTEPKITPGKSGEYDTTNIARESLEEDFTLVTETMAQLFARQGKLDKARKVYRRLMELHPEKSVYFAAQLKNLNTNKKG